MHFLMTPVGSHGDVHPFIGIGRALQARGHEVTVITSEPFRDAVEAASLTWVQNGSKEEYAALTASPDIWHPLHGLPHVMRAVTANLARLYDRIEQNYRAGETVLVGHTIGFATRAFEEKHKAPAATVHLAPAVFRSDHAIPALAPGLRPNGLPRWVKRTLFRTADWFLIDRHVTKELNTWRKSLGLPAVQRVLHQHLHSPQRVIALFPDWFGQPQVDWPSQCRLTGFPRYDEAEHRPMSAALQSFLDEGSPPLLVTPGSANAHAKKLLTAALDGAQRMNRRIILATRYSENLPKVLPAQALHVDYAPFSLLMPRCSALLHHGGIGTLAQGLAAGIPQLIFPLTFDQPDNATRIKELGVGTFVLPHRMNGARVERALEPLLKNEQVLTQCALYRERVLASNALLETCQSLEAVHSEHALLATD
jgi:rhamnosyltransferase subunit B